MFGCVCKFVCVCVGQVLIFAEKKQDVDAIHEYLLLKGVEAVAIHGGKGRAVVVDTLVYVSHIHLR